MSPITLAGPAVEPVTLADAKAHLRLDGDNEDALVAALVTAARVTVEHATRRALLAQTWRVRLDRWPPGRAVPLPLAPVLAITAVRVFMATGASSPVDPALYRLDESADPARLIIDPAVPEPGLRDAGIEVDATYGYGVSPGDVPAPLRLAIQRLAARWFERRGDEEGEPDRLPGDIRALIAPFIRARLA